jgi:HD superfamily phosphohydrolase
MAPAQELPVRPTPIAIHDPIHGSIEVTVAELKLIDSQPFQRLRNIKQLGFADMAFPGATHSRYSHSLGAMQMATRMVDRLLPTLPMDLAERRPLLRQAVRLACLFHDLGHPPMSHVSERVMPKVRHLALTAAMVGDDHASRQATHEDYTLLLLTQTELRDLITTHMGDQGITPELIAALICGRHLPYPHDPTQTTQDILTVQGWDLMALLHGIISGELDADRMDYLRRDAYYCGVSYGHFDHVWLCNNLTAVQHDGRLTLGLLHKAVWGFENFLLARYHMFLSVYYHHTTVGFDHLLGRYYAEGEYVLPADAQAYLQTDDIALAHMLRQSKSIWAKRVVARRAWRLLLETHAFGSADDDTVLIAALTDAQIPFFRIHSQGLLSRYFTAEDAAAGLHVLEPERHRVRPISAYTPLFDRYRDRAHISRIYCQPEDFVRARECVPRASPR